ncbi:urea ABC transporter permease subunit UrtC [Glycomyces algeriensis]|uniref:Urea ABC transporter permease subunit UrtC n=1 Tax=Glycomyces algeriensis TaxID=256037 RepID=A0A9W6GBB0_9ACTN|nr:urea ABC transporter permease subunit UrtC [Glycomyces algeriensis]MDA1367420.1 urea ABC transporter permease subunit UrtC [Glycomyces algeriensis]MDR7350926.1 urea transport system permease protein [Glycomyces algeriensis]GLI43638.1 urea ABC transporter permease subunit UrtC [Glycomyces algeriensis]
MSRFFATRAGVWSGFGAAALVLFGAAPLLLSGFRLGLLAQFLCYAIVAVGIGLAWGRGGMLTLGQGVFFGMGAYLMAMHMKMADAEFRNGHGAVPDFMELAGIRELPAYWVPFASPVFTIAMILVLPTGFAVLLGFAVFKRRVKGAYFAILSQALAGAFAILLIGQQSMGGFNGLSRFRYFFGYNLDDAVNQQMLYFIAAGVLLVVVAVALQLRRSRYGELLVAVRDAEERVRFLGYDAANIKVVAYAAAALFAAVAGAIFVPVVGIISPASIGIVPSIMFILGVAIGGRASLVGPVVGALAVAWAQTALSEQFPSAWTYAQGLLFIVVIALLPGGIASVAALTKRFQAKSATVEAAA